MKIEKLRINVTEDQMQNPSIAYDVQVRKKINEIIKNISCRKCDEVVALNPQGLCLGCFDK